RGCRRRVRHGASAGRGGASCPDAAHDRRRLPSPAPRVPAHPRIPELPDVVLYIEHLTARVVGQPLERVRLATPFLVRSVDPPLGEAEGRRVVGLRRLGKRIVLELEGELFLVFHLMIAGRFRWRPPGARVPGKVARLHRATRETLREWTDRLRRESGGRFPERVTAFCAGMAVHGRYRQPCPDCGAPVQRIVYAENETNYCARCQTGGVLLADRS